jgi:hypothetical protein
MQLLRCMVALAGDQGNVVNRHRGRPIVFPELPVLQYLHGEDAITDIAVVGECDMGNDEALIRLQTIYGKEAVEKVYPGNRPRLPQSDRSIPICTRPVYVPRPARPESPDPILRPLDAFAQAKNTRFAPEPEPEDEPTPEEIAAHTQDQDNDQDNDDLALQQLPEGVRDVVRSRPNVRVEDQPVTRAGFRGAARQARRTSEHLPDVSGARERRPEEPDRDTPRG